MLKADEAMKAAARVLAIAAMAVMSSFPGVAASEQEPVRSAEKPKFAWGAEFGSDIDLSAHDMSNINFSVLAGVRWRSVGFGAGATVDMMVSNSCRSFPIFAVFQWNVPRTRDLMFIDARAGVSINYLHDNVNQAGGYASLGLGINLARGKGFQSFLSAGYTWVSRKDATLSDKTVVPYPDLHYAGIKLGIMF